MKTVQFNTNGGPVVAEVTAGFAQPGSYRLLLWEANANLVVMREQGNFINTADDAYLLPTPNEHNHERIVECLATIMVTPPILDWAVTLTILQDGQVLDSETQGDRAAGMGAQTVDIFVQLVAG